LNAWLLAWLVGERKLPEDDHVMFVPRYPPPISPTNLRWISEKGNANNKECHRKKALTNARCLRGGAGLHLWWMPVGWTVGWLVGRLFGRMVGWLVGWLFILLVVELGGGMGGWSVGWLVALLLAVSWLVVWQLVVWLVIWLVGWLVV